MKSLFTLVLLAASLAGAERIAENRGAAAVWHSLNRLSTTARVMHITAHPDDEDGATLAWLSRAQGAHVVLLSLTRGESGANRITGDFFDSLGALRTLELLKAAEYYGAEVRFTRFADFGYSKTLEETLRNWDREEVLADVVRIIRQEKPHIILAKWRGDGRDGHGHHQAAGLIARLAYEAAGDPKRFPEQIAEGLAPWQPQKLYVNNRRASDDWTVEVPAGDWDPLLGRSYAQIALDGLRHQRTQGAGSAVSRPGAAIRYYKLAASQVGLADKESSFFDRLPLQLEAYRPLAAAVTAARQSFKAQSPASCGPALARVLASVQELRKWQPGNPDLTIKERQAQEALASALGLELEVLVEPRERPQGPFSAFSPYETLQVAAPGDTFGVSVGLHNLSGSPIEVRAGFTPRTPPGVRVEGITGSRFEVSIPAGVETTSAYWVRESIRETSYRLTTPTLFGTPVPPPPISVRVVYDYLGVRAALEEPALVSYIDATGVQRRRPLVIGPPVSVRFSTEAGILPLGSRTHEVSCTVSNHVSGPASGSVSLKVPNGWTVMPAEASFQFVREGEERSLSFRVAPPSGLRPGSFALEAVARHGGRDYTSGFQAVSWPGLDSLYLAQPSLQTVRAIDVRVAPGLSAGYVMGPGDDVPHGLRQLGVDPVLLDPNAIATADLSRFDVILLGIRAYATREELKTHNARLLDYVSRGGVLIVQYNTQEYDNNYGPYPYTMTARAEEVSEEDSPVRILAPTHPVFSWPNRITPADFEGWVEQRGSKFWMSWDERYTPLVETRDTGQEPQKGIWLAARHGDGLYIYSALAWYRQLPYAVPGAVRLFANLISLGAKDAGWRTAR